jgi:hypothetical protein
MYMLIPLPLPDSLRALARALARARKINDPKEQIKKIKESGTGAGKGTGT